MSSKVTRTQQWVFKMESAENPVVSCEAYKAPLDFDAIVREMSSRQEEIKKHLNSEIQLSEMKQQFKPTTHASEILSVNGIEHNS